MPDIMMAVAWIVPEDDRATDQDEFGFFLFI